MCFSSFCWTAHPSQARRAYRKRLRFASVLFVSGILFRHQILIRIVSCSYMFCRIFMIRFDTSREFKSEHTLLREHRVVCFFNIHKGHDSLHPVPYAILLQTDQVKNLFCTRLLWFQSKLSSHLFSGSFNVRLYFFNQPFVQKFEWSAEKRNRSVIRQVRPTPVLAQ